MPGARRAAAALALGLTTFIGLPLAAWGIDGLPRFFAHPARLAYVLLALALQIGIIIAMPGAGAQRAGREGARRRGWDLALIQLLSLALMLSAPYSDRSGLAILPWPDAFRYPGLALFAAGMLVMQWAEATLGKQFSVTVTLQEGHKLVTGGPFKYLRHPRYLGVLVFFAGVSLVFRSWLGLALDGAMAAVLALRIRAEEALLRQEFGEEWDAYAKRSWRLVPWVY